MTFKSQSRLVVFLVSLASLTLILFNFYSSKIKSGVRAYINGESVYSKGQKDALLNLTYYLNTQDSVYWQTYVQSLKVPMSDNKARHAMANQEPDSVAFNYFIEGKVHPADIDIIIWMFKNFREVEEFKNAVALWAKSEAILVDVSKSAEELKYKIDKGILDVKSKEQLASKIYASNVTLSVLEIDFSNTLSGLARKIEKLLNWVNILVTLLIVGSLSAYLMFLIAKLYKSREELKKSYDKVFDLNVELDTFVYSLSHDLRAPLTSLQGLVRFSSLETDIESIKDNMLLMDKLLDKQDVFIKDVISLLQRRNLVLQPRKLDLKGLIEDAFSLNEHNADSKSVSTALQITEDLEEIENDIVFVKIIINNLISNAFKYSDPMKGDQFIKVGVSSEGDSIVIKVEDNGIGISKEFHQKIFDMFYILDSRKRGTGLGLYIIKQAVEKLGGTIHLDSVLGQGSKFTISLPKQG